RAPVASAIALRPIPARPGRRCRPARVRVLPALPVPPSLEGEGIACPVCAMHPEAWDGSPVPSPPVSAPGANPLWQCKVRPEEEAATRRREVQPAQPQVSPTPPPTSLMPTDTGTAHAPVLPAPGNYETTFPELAALHRSAQHPG